MRSQLAALGMVMVLGACGGGAAQASGRTVSLRLRGSPPNATVTVDDQIVGSLQIVMARGVALPPGPHRVSVESAGYLPWDKIVVATDQPVVVAVD
ncbi:MAG: PEGA domain-containing protein, partial [Polyangiaceae bacterium]